MEIFSSDASGAPSVVRVGDTVRRHGGPWTGAVHGLLAHLEARGFAAAPRVLGFDDLGREILTFVPGESGASAWRHIVTLEGLERFARLLRAYHDAVAGYDPGPHEWSIGVRPVTPDAIVCHGDFGPWNVVWRDGRPVSILDWDEAYPGPATDDVAYALEYVVPFRDDDTCLRWLAYDEPPDRRSRLLAFLAAYGMEPPDDPVGFVAARQRLSATHARLRGARAHPRRSDWPTVADLATRADWSEAHRAWFTG